MAGEAARRTLVSPGERKKDAKGSTGSGPVLGEERRDVTRQSGVKTTTE